VPELGSMSAPALAVDTAPLAAESRTLPPVDVQPNDQSTGQPSDDQPARQP
jgi:hypothetical protein